MVDDLVAEAVGLTLPEDEWERVALETVELRPADDETVAEAAELEATLVMRLERETEAEAEAEAEAEERTLETMLEMALESEAEADSPPVRPNWAE
jgi:DNA-binding protein H-NS